MLLGHILPRSLRKSHGGIPQLLHPTTPLKQETVRSPTLLRTAGVTSSEGWSGTMRMWSKTSQAVLGHEHKRAAVPRRSAIPCAILSLARGQKCQKEVLVSCHLLSSLHNQHQLWELPCLTPVPAVGPVKSCQTGRCLMVPLDDTNSWNLLLLSNSSSFFLLSSR